MSRNFSSLLVAEARVDDHRPHAADDERPHRQRDAIALVGGRLRRPQRLRHDAEHRAAVEPRKKPSHSEIELEIAEREPRDRRMADLTELADCAWRLATAASARPARRAPPTGWMNATSAPSAPGRGCSSMSRDAARLQLRERRAMSSTRSVMWCRPGTALLDVPRDRRVRRRRLEQLELRLADRHEMRAHALRRAPLRALRSRGRARRDRTRARPPDPPRRCRRDRGRLSRDQGNRESWKSGKCSASAEESRPPRVYGSTSRAAIRSTIAASSPGVEHVALEVLHEALRDELAQPVLAARPAPRQPACRRRARGTARSPRPVRRRRRRSSPRSSRSAAATRRAR